MVVLSAARVAQREPRTHIAMLRWLRVGIGFVLPRSFKLTSDPAHIRDVTLNVESFGSSSAPQHNMHPLGLHTLNPRQQVRIKTKLNYRCRLGGTGKFSLHNLVRPRPEGTGSVDPNQEVRPTSPRSVEKSCLIDDIHT